jgi:hypothetical protein
MEESFCYKKKFVTNLSSFVQENVKDDFTRQNILYKLNELIKTKIEEKEYNNKIEQIIRELFRKITLNLSEKDKENKILNKRINLYMKQIDENVKKININNKRILTNRVPSMTLNKSVNDNEINKLKFRLNTQQKTLSSTKNNIKKMNLSINKVDELIKSSNFKTNEIETNKITSALAECKNVVQKMSRGLNTESNKNKISINLNFNKKTKSYNELLKQRENYVNVKNLKDKNLPKQIFKQYFINLSKFSKTIIDYGLNDNDNNDDKDL